MIDWLRQPEDVRVCLDHDIRMCRVKPSTRELFAADRMEKMVTYIADLKEALKPLAYADIIPFTIAEQFALHSILVKPSDIEGARKLVEGSDD